MIKGKSGKEEGRVGGVPFAKHPAGEKLVRKVVLRMERLEGSVRKRSQ